MYGVNQKNGFPYARNDTIYWKPNGYNFKVYDNILHVIGNTPIVRLNRIPHDYGLECEMYAKCEFLNPGGSIKDRISYAMLVHAQKSGEAKPGTKFFVPTSGNTGIGVALSAAVAGHPCTIVTPDKNSDEKMNTIRLLGSEVVQTPATAPWDSPESFLSVTEKLLKENPNSICLDQYTNNVNPVTHYEYTAEEILLAVGNVDMIVMGAGTGGTVTGVAHKIKEKCPKCIVVVVDPLGSIIFGEGQVKQFFVEGIGGDFVPHVLDKSLVDKVMKPNDKQSFNMAREVIRKEGLLCGGSSGAAMFSAIKAAKELKLGAGKRVVVILPDGIRNYMTKFVSDQWMEAHLFKEPPEYDHLKWWNGPVTNLNIDTSVPRVHENQSCLDALRAMESKHNVALVINDKGFFRGALSKNSLRQEATNPKHKETFNFNDPVKRHLIKNCYKIIANEKNSTVGLASRILDITPFVVVVIRRHDEQDKDEFIPKGIVTPDMILDCIIEE